MDKIKGRKGLRAKPGAKHASSRARRFSVWQLFALGICLTAIITWVIFASNGAGRAQAAAEPPAQPNQNVDRIADSALRQIQALLDEKEARTPAQQKIDSQLLYALKMRRGERIADGVTSLEVNVATDSEDMTIVDIAAGTQGPLMEDIVARGGDIINFFPQYDSIRARVPIDQLEAIAASPQVRFIQPKQDAITNRYSGSEGLPALAPGFAERAARVRSALLTALPLLTQQGTVIPNIGSKTSEGDVTHKAATARTIFGMNGAGVRIGVLSDGVSNLAASTASGDLAGVTVLPGQQGDGDEGTAMLEIIHDLAPGAQLFFATAFNGSASFAQNIRNLRTAGCDIIVDDVFYFAETPFQDGQTAGVNSNTNGAIIFQAVNDVTADGALYFSSAGNSGNKNDGTTGTYQSDFIDGGPLALLPGGNLHNFGGGQVFDNVTVTSTGPCNLFWADPLGGSANDYDLFVLNSTSTSVVSSSTNIQNGTQDPFEQSGGLSTISNRVVVLKKTAAANRFFYVSANRGRLGVTTEGVMRGHPCTANGFGVAATPAAQFAGPPNPQGPFPNPHNSTNMVELFSSDGPRRLFFNADSSAITPGNFSSTGGTLRQKPDITAADGVSVTGAGGFPSTFFGTSAAAPHAGAIAALLKSANPSLTRNQIRNALVNTAIDIEAPGVDRDSGAGIVMALEALTSVGAVAAPNFELGTVTAAESGGNGNGVIDPGETANLTVQLKNTGVANANGITTVLSSTTPGVTIGQPNSAYPNLSFPAGIGANNTAFRFSLSGGAPCPLRIGFTLTISFTGGGSPKRAVFEVQTGTPPLAINSILDTTAPTPGTGFTAITGIQNLRLFRDGNISSCDSTKTCPGTSGTLTRRFDAYTFMACPGASQCVIVTLTTTCPVTTNPLFAGAYLGSFDPNNVCTNYLGDAGFSALTTTFAFTVAGGASFVVVVNEVNQDQGLNCPYTLTLSNVCLPCNIVSGPRINSVEPSGKHLIIHGSGYDDGAKLYMDGDKQKTVNDEVDPTHTLIGKKVFKKISRGQTVMLQVKNAGGAESNIFGYTRPL